VRIGKQDICVDEWTDELSTNSIGVAKLITGPDSF